MLALVLGCSAHHPPEPVVVPEPAPVEAPVPPPPPPPVVIDPTHNAEACKLYVETLGSAPCTPIHPNADELCPDTLNQGPCDLRPYYGCMTDAVKCIENDGFLDVSGQVACPPPSC